MSSLEKRKQDIISITSWLNNQHGECRLWNDGVKGKLNLTPQDIMKLVRIEKTGYGTAALLRDVQMSGKKCDSLDGLLIEAKAISERKRGEIGKAFDEKKGQIFLQPQGIKVTPDGVKQLCEDSQCGPAALGYVSALSFGKKKYNEWEDLASVIKRLHHLGRDPLGILKEGAVKPVEKKEPKPEEVVDMDHSEIEGLTEYLQSAECRVLVQKKSINDMLITWLLREGRGFTLTMRHVKHMNRVGSIFGSMREVTVGIRRANRIMDDMKAFLADSKLLSPPVSPTVEQLFTLYEAGSATTFTLGFLQQLQKDGKSFDSIEALGPAISSLKEHAHDQIMEIFSDMDCVLLNSVDDVTDAQLNDLLVAGGSAADTLKHLQALNNSHRTFLNMGDLALAMHARSGVPVAAV